MANPEAGDFQYVPYSEKKPPQALPPPHPPTGNPTSNYDAVPKPKPKPRKIYEAVQLTTPPHTVTSDPPPSSKQPPAIPKKPTNYSPTVIHRAPPPPPPTSGSDTYAVDENILLKTNGTVDVKAVAKMLSSQTLPRKKEEEISEQTSPPHSLQGRRKSEADIRPPKNIPQLPGRIDKKQKLLDEAKVNPIPTGPRGRAPSISSQPAPTPADLNWRPTGESMALSELANSHSSRFPLRIHLLDGYYGQTTRFTLSSSDIFDIHFAKCTHVVSVRDSMGIDYSIPLNSAIQFGMVYWQRPSDEPPQLMFRTVEDLLSLDTLPKVICATTKWSKGGKSSVHEKEVLLVKGIYKPPLRNRRALKCHSLTTGTRKLLPEECEGNFSVDPAHTKLHVYEFTVKFKSLLPCRAMMFLGSDMSSHDSPVFRNVPKSLFKKPINVISVASEVSLGATSVTTRSSPVLDAKSEHIDFERKPIKSVLPMEIPLDSHLGEIEVEILEAPSKEETEKLYMNTQELLEKANKQSYQRLIAVDKGSDRYNDTQSLFYMEIRPEKSDIGVAFETSSIIYERMDGAARTEIATTSTGSTGKKKATKKPDKVLVDIKEDDGNVSDSSDEHMYEMIDIEEQEMKYTSPAVQQLAPFSPPHISPPHQHAFSPPHISPPHQHAFSPPHQHAFSLPHQHAFSPHVPFLPMHQTASLPVTDAQCNDPYSLPRTSSSVSGRTLLPPQPSQFNTSTSYVHMVPKASVPSDAATQVTPETREANKAFLKNISVAKLQELLLVMNLGQHRAKFMEEQISGEILIELGQDDLERDLDIKSKIHRVRLMKIIEGQHSARNILEGESPYEF